MFSMKQWCELVGHDLCYFSEDANRKYYRCSRCKAFTSISKRKVGEFVWYTNEPLIKEKQMENPQLPEGWEIERSVFENMASGDAWRIYARQDKEGGFFIISASGATKEAAMQQLAERIESSISGLK